MVLKHAFLALGCALIFTQNLYADVLCQRRGTIKVVLGSTNCPRGYKILNLSPFLPAVVPGAKGDKGDPGQAGAQGPAGLKGDPGSFGATVNKCRFVSVEGSVSTPAGVTDSVYSTSIQLPCNDGEFLLNHTLDIRKADYTSLKVPPQSIFLTALGADSGTYARGISSLVFLAFLPEQQKYEDAIYYSEGICCPMS
jgi:hypothetical protein